MRKTTIPLMLLALVASHQLLAQNWTGAVNADWNNSANWSSWPLGGADISINPSFYTGNAASPVISANSVFSPAEVLIENGGQLTINADLSTQDNVEVMGIGSGIIMNNGTFSVNWSDDGRLIMDLGGTITINGGTTQVGERFIVGEDALATIEDGTVTSGERMIMDLGGRIIQNDGTVSVAATFAMADGSATNGSGYELNGGSLSITGEMGFENETGNFEPTFVQNGGTMTVNGEVFWFGEAPGTGTPRWIVNAGTASVSGPVYNMPLSTVNLYLKLSGTGELTMSGGPLELLHAQDSVVQEDNSLLHFTGTTSVINPGVVEATDGLVAVDGNVTFTGSGVFRLHNIDIANGQELDHQSPSVLQVSGTINKFGDLTMNANPMEWDGSEWQEINGTGTLVLEDLTLENTAQGVLVQLPVFVNGHVQLNQGVVSTNATTPFVISDNATASSGNAASFINGPLHKVGDDAFVFPIGKNGKWRRFEMSAPTNITSEFRAEYMDETYAYVTPVNSPLTAVSNLEYWQFDQLNGSASVQVALYWEDAAASAITDCGELSIAQANGTSWDNVLAVAGGTCSGNGNGFIQSNSPISTFGDFTFGFYAGVTNQTVQICDGDSYSVGTSTYTVPGTYIDVLQDINSNDSIVLTTLTVVVPETGIVGQNGGLQSLSDGTGTYQWLDCANGNTAIAGETNVFYAPGQSGVYALEVTEDGCTQVSDCIDFTLVDTTICEGSTYQVGSTTYTIAGAYTDQLLPDSVVYTQLGIFTINTAITFTGLELSAENMTATAYQWIDCEAGNTPIAGATGLTFTAPGNGSYAVILEEAGCTDTSACLAVTWAFTEELSEENLSVYPNPFQDWVEIHVPENASVADLQLRDLMGKTVSFSVMEDAGYRIQPHGDAGLYFLEVRTENGESKIVQLIKK